MKKNNVVLQCGNHPKYTGARDPKAGDCVTCWKIRVTYLKEKVNKLTEKLKKGK